ncbi:MAG: cytochrome [Gloeomargaritaceae cyanobacterium C42_A2020_066]|nr:cytochrome [Gloeomargaritaceae cyanobacterium C42_A2020_066]
MARVLIGVMGPGETATAADCAVAYVLGQGIALADWGLLTGGRPQGVMAAAIAGAKSVGGFTVGVLPGSKVDAADPNLDVVIPTGLGNARNLLNVLASRVVIACGVGLGTISEVALALKASKPVIWVHCPPAGRALFETLAPHLLTVVETADEALATVEAHLTPGSSTVKICNNSDVKICNNSED